MENIETESNEFTPEEIEIIDKVDSFFRELYRKDFSGKKWELIHSILANFLIFSLININHKLPKGGFDSHFIDQIFKLFKKFQNYLQKNMGN